MDWELGDGRCKLLPFPVQLCLSLGRKTAFFARPWVPLGTQNGVIYAAVGAGSGAVRFQTPAMSFSGYMTLVKTLSVSLLPHSHPGDDASECQGYQAVG